MEPVIIGLNPSTGAGSTAAAPGAGVAFSSALPANGPGDYELQFFWWLTATAETSPNNVKIKTNAVNLITGLPSVSGIAPVFLKLPRVTLDGTNFVQLAATGAAAAGSVYNGLIICTRVF